MKFQTSVWANQQLQHILACLPEAITQIKF